MTYNLRRISDGKGDSGSLSEAITWASGIREVVDYKPTIGCSMLVGSAFARSYSHQDYWLTTAITEILEEIKNEKTHYIRFKTGNSEYEWWGGKYPKTIE